MERSRDEPCLQVVASEAEADTADPTHLGNVPTPLHSSERARRLVPFDVAMRYQFLPMSVLSSRSSRQITVAGDLSRLRRLTADIEFALGERILAIPYRGDKLLHDIERAYLGSETRLVAAAHKAGLEHQGRELCVSFRQDTPELRDSSESGLTEFVASLVEFAIARGSSDLHLTPSRERVTLGLRIGRDVHYLTDSLCDRAIYERVVARLKILSGVNPTLKAVPLDGSFSVSLATESVGIRFSSLPTVFGERVVLRMSTSATGGAYHELGFDSATYHVIDELIIKGCGLSLLAGPTGSGKTTSLYGIVRRLIDLGKVVISIEDPVERWIDGMSQASISESSGLTFAAAAKAVLRQGPDVLVIGEIRDEESARTAVRSALCGHLVLSTIHARCVFEALERLASLCGSSLSELQGISAVIAQRLVATTFPKASDEQSSVLLATQTLPLNAEAQRVLKNEKLARSDFYRLIKEGPFIPFEQYARRWLEEGLIGMEQYRCLVQLDQ